MPRYIDADKLKESLKELKAEGNNLKYVQGLQDAIDGYFPQIIDDAPTVDVQPDNGWISVEDRLPESDGFYLAWYTFKDGGHALDIFYFNAGSPISNAITHWQHLPKPPKEVENETD